MNYVRNIVIYDDHVNSFGDIYTQIYSCEQHLGALHTNGIDDDDIYGYISIILENHHDNSCDFKDAYILCKTEKDYYEAYNRCCDSFISHPDVIDLRGLGAKLEECD